MRCCSQRAESLFGHNFGLQMLKNFGLRSEVYPGLSLRRKNTFCFRCNLDEAERQLERLILIILISDFPHGYLRTSAIEFQNLQSEIVAEQRS